MTKITFERIREDILLRKVCLARGENISNFVKRPVRMELARLSFLTNEEKKILGFSGGENIE